MAACGDAALHLKMLSIVVIFVIILPIPAKLELLSLQYWFSTEHWKLDIDH
jgi:hypothetical protein